MSNSVFVEFHLISSVASNQCPFRAFLSLGNRKKSHGARSGEYGGCFSAMMIMPCYEFGLQASELIIHVVLKVGTSVWREPGPSVFSLKIEVVDLTTMLVTTCQTIWCHGPGGHILNFHHCENLEFEICLDSRWRWVVTSSLLYPQGGRPVLTIG